MIHRGVDRLPASPKYRRVAAVVVLALLGVLGGGLAYSGISPEWGLIIAIFGIVWLPVLVKGLLRRMDLFEPLMIFAIAWSVMFTARPAAMLSSATYDLLVYNVRSGFVPMLWMALVGAVGFQLGYLLPLGALLSKRMRSLPVHWHADTVVVYSVVLSLFGFLLFGLFVLQAGGLGAYQQLTAGRLERQAFFLSTSSTAYLYDAIFLAFPAGLLLIATGAIRRRRFVSLLGVILLAAVALEEGPGGIRSWLFPIFLSPLLLMYLRRDKRPGLLKTAIAAFLVFSVGIVFIGSFRNSAVRSQSGIDSLLTSSLTDPVGSWNRFILGWDSEMASLLALETQVVPSTIPFQNGLATGEVVAQPVPRQFWPNKPRAGNEILTKTLFIDPGVDSSSLQYSPMADFYLDFGYGGVFVGMFGLGLLAQTHFDYFRRNRSNPAVQLLFASTLPFWIVLLRGSIADTFGRLVFVIPPLLLGIWLARTVVGRAQREGNTAGGQSPRWTGVSSGWAE